MQLAEFLKSQEIPLTQWDLLLFGDGSGINWKGAGGYAACIVDQRLHLRACVVGARSNTTVNRMELTAYTEALSYHYYKMLNETVKNPPYRVWIFTDSEYTAKCGSREYSRKANLDLWTLADWYETRGYRLRWRWVPRNSNPVHVMVDRLSGSARTALKGILVDNDELFKLLPSIEQPCDDIAIELTSCTKCQAPMLPTEPVCPQCGMLAAAEREER